jgi:dephospho-CoA kinase
VFSDPEHLKTLNAIMHPRIFDMIRERLDILKEDGVKTAVVEAALLIEANWTALATEVWVLTSPSNDVVQRLLTRNNMTEETIRARIDSQLPQDERVTYGDAIIENDGDLSKLTSAVEDAWHQRVPA